jgi:hypothetical protein
MKGILLTLGIALCCASALAAAQVKGITAQITKQTRSNVTCRVFNQSSKSVSAYAIGFDGVYADGKPYHTEYTMRAKPVEPGGFFDFDCSGAGQQGTVSDIRLTPLLVVYTDQSFEAADAKTYDRIMYPWVAQRKAIQLALQIVQQSLADGSDPEPPIEDALKQSRLATASPNPGAKRIDLSRPTVPDDNTLEQILADLQKIKTHDGMEQYANELQDRLQKPLLPGGN